MQNVYFLDIDDCLITTSTLTKDHLKVISDQLEKYNIKQAKEITAEFANSFKRLYDNHQGIQLSLKKQKLMDTYMRRLTQLEQPVLQKYGEVKRWSREVCLYIAGEKYGVKLTNEQIVLIAQALWEKITQKAIFYPDTKPFLESLIHRKIPFFLITSSDSRLTLHDNEQLFYYDPQYSRNLKMKRLRLFTDMGIAPHHIFIGDPYDKPNPWIFQQAFDYAKKELKGSFHSIMIGDSYKNDLVPAQKVGMYELILINRIKSKGKYPSNITIITAFDELILR